MGSDGVWRRIRWGNVARLAGLVALALLVVTWPRLGGRAPRLPPAAPVPIVTKPPGAKRPARREPLARREQRVSVRPRGADGDAPRRRRRRGRGKPAARAKRPARAEPPARARAPARGELPAPREPPARATPPAAARRRPAKQPADPAPAEFGLP
jgi:hypothetical protein